MGLSLMTIRMQLRGAKEVVAESKAVQGAMTRTAATAKAVGAKSAAAAAGGVSALRKGLTMMGTAAKWSMGILGVGGIFALADAAHETEELAKSTKRLTTFTKLNAVQASSWIEVMGQRGVDINALGMGFTTLSKQIDSARTEAGSARDTFDRLGISTDFLRNNNQQAVIMQIAEAFHRMDDPVTRAASSATLFGRSSKNLIAMLSDGKGAMKGYLGEAKKYGAVMGQDMVDKTLEQAGAQRRMNLAMDGLQLKIGQAFLPIMDKAVIALTDFLQQLRTGKGTGGDIRDFVEGLVDVGKDLAPFFQNILLPIVVGILGQLIPAVQGAAQILGWLGEKAEPLKPIFGALGAIIAFAFGGEIAKAITWVSKFSKILRVVLWPVKILMKFMGALGRVFRSTGAVLEYLGVVSKKVFMTIVYAAVGVAGSILQHWQKVEDFFGKIKGVIAGAMSGLGAILAGPFQWAKTAIGNVIDWIDGKIDFLGDRIDDLKGMAESVTDSVGITPTEVTPTLIPPTGPIPGAGSLGGGGNGHGGHGGDGNSGRILSPSNRLSALGVESPRATPLFYGDHQRNGSPVYEFHVYLSGREIAAEVTQQAQSAEARR